MRILNIQESYRVYVGEQITINKKDLIYIFLYFLYNTSPKKQEIDNLFPVQYLIH